MSRSLVTFLLDETGSMGAIRDDTISGFNTYLSDLQDEKSVHIDFTFLKFDSNKLEKVCVAEPVRNVLKLDKKTYVPGASTPLIDAAYKTIKAVEGQISGTEGQPDKIVVTILTDGEENASTEHTWAELNALVKEKTKEGWQFNFLGTSIDAYAQSSRMGIAATNTMSTGVSGQNVAASYAAASRSTRAFTSGATMDASFSTAERKLAGDNYADKYGVGNHNPFATAQPATPKAPQQKKDPQKAVDDFSLNK